MKITYHLNGGHWNYKDEVKMRFYLDFYNFVNRIDASALKDISFNEFANSEPYIIGNLLSKYYLEEKIGGQLAKQSDKYFIGYCYKNKMYQELIPHLIDFFSLWRDIEGCKEDYATDFFASSWASLVDTAKFFKYTTDEDLKNSPESPSVRDKRIFNSIQNCPEQRYELNKLKLGESHTLLSPRKTGFNFFAWYDNPGYSGDIITSISYQAKNINLYARWQTHTFFFANDGYLNFEEIYDDFLKDFSLDTGLKLSKDKTWEAEDAWVSDFCKKAKGHLNSFFSKEKNYKKWSWLIDYFKRLYEASPNLQKNFNFENNQFANEDHLRWELNSLFVSRYHLVYPKTKDYSGLGIKEKLALSTNSFHIRIDYPVGEDVVFPKPQKPGYKLLAWYDNPEAKGLEISKINDDSFASKTLYAKWLKV